MGHEQNATASDIYFLMAAKTFGQGKVSDGGKSMHLYYLISLSPSPIFLLVLHGGVSFCRAFSLPPSLSPRPSLSFPLLP